MDERQRFEQGLSLRREVLGEAHVKRSLENRNPFNQEFQDVVTRHAWGEVWTRPGLPRRTRSMITVAMLVALNRPDELRLHLRGALNNGVTREEIKEVLLQTAAYCGIPAANSAFHLAEEIFADIDRAPAKK
jgi:4-carboxymuconolactone decarboxylase